ncbi:MAG TPA: hypothetical protein VFQ74_08645 [Pseudolysinimonas sp.]|nr:hypothetical protein [Pseudolysinimonas sp.]
MRSVGSLRRVALPAVLGAAVIIALAGCVPTPTPTRTPAPKPSASSPATPTLDLQGSAAENLAYFDYVNQKFIAEGGDLSGRPFIDNLVKAGFPKADMEVTPDRTSVNLAADNISFSVRLGTTCLIGQYGNTGYSSTALKLLSTGRCLVGTTRKIDW